MRNCVTILVLIFPFYFTFFGTGKLFHFSLLYSSSYFPILIASTPSSFFPVWKTNNFFLNFSFHQLLPQNGKLLFFLIASYFNLHLESSSSLIYLPSSSYLSGDGRDT